MRVEESSGEATRLPELDGFALWPSFLPDGEHFLYLGEIERGQGQGHANLGIHVASIEDPSERRLLLPVSSRAIYSEGYLLYVDDGALMARPFDLEDLTIAGDAAVLEDDVQYFRSHGGATFSAAAGRLAYVTSKPPTAHVWVGRTGEDLGALGEPGPYSRVTSLSPDGTRAIGAVKDPRIGTTDLVLFDLDRGTSSRVTTEDIWENFPVWSPDSQRIAFASDPNGPPDLYVLDLAGGGPKALLWAAPGVQETVAWSPDGRDILFMNRADDRTLWSLPAAGGDDPGPLAPSAPGRADSEASFSPDGRWLAVASSESGRSEIYAQPFRRPGPRLRLSQSGGRRPRWRGDGRELFFQSGQSLQAIAVDPGEDFVSGRPTTLFTLERGFAFQDTMPDGERFLLLTEPSPLDWQPIQVMLGWQDFLPESGSDP
jgi:dipeptidyl aminopeptidase/acylaminoacyl peptidase